MGKGVKGKKPPSKFRNYNAFARRLREEKGLSIPWLHRQALDEGKEWTYELFRRVLSGWHRNEEIEEWARNHGYGEYLDEAQADVRRHKMRKLKEEVAKYGA